MLEKEPPRSSFRSIALFIFLLFFGSRLLLVPAGLYARQSLIESGAKDLKGSYAEAPPIISMWTVWDSGMYRILATAGEYPKTIDRSQPFYLKQFSLYSRMPLYPFLSRWLAPLVGNVVIAGLVLSNVMALLSCVLLFYLIRDEWGEKIARRTVALYVFAPFSCVLSGFFAEALFNALLCAALLAARHGRVLGAACIGSLLPVTKMFGLFALPLLVIVLIRKSGFSKGWIRGSCITVGLGIAPFLLLWIHLYDLTGDPLIFINSLRPWAKDFTPELWPRLSAYVTRVPTVAAFELSAIVAAFVLSLYLARSIYRKTGASMHEFPIWIWCMLAPFLLTANPQSYPRYTISMFPLYLAVALLVRDDRWFKAAAVVSLIASVAIMMLWTRGSLYAM